MYIKDYIRNTLLKKGAEAFSKDDEEEPEPKEGLSIVEEQKKLKNDFLSTAKKVEEDEDDLFSLRSKSKDEVAHEEKEYLVFKSEQDKKKEKEPVLDDLSLLRTYWQAQELDENEKFLRDYILNKRWVDNENSIPTYDEVVGTEYAEHDDEEDEILDQQDEYEAKYNFRYEEEGGTELATHPRDVTDTLRRKDDKRKIKRHEVKERKDKEKVRKEEELKRYKNLKKKEILEKLKEIEKNHWKQSRRIYNG